MFRAVPFSSSGRQIVLLQPLALSLSVNSRMHALFFISTNKAVQTVNHSYIYISLLLATCFGFCAKPL